MMPERPDPSPSLVSETAQRTNPLSREGLAARLAYCVYRSSYLNERR
jgi:hypothetical protein